MEENIFQPLEEYYNKLKSKDNEIEAAIKAFMEKHDITNFKTYIKGGKKYVDVVGNVIMDSKDKIDGIIPFPFGKVSGSFCCNDCWLSSLENAPLEVGDCFYCSGNKLESLVGAPKKVGTRFECDGNPGKFTSKDISKVCEAGYKVKIMPLDPVVTMWNGDGNYPTKVEVDKYRLTTFDDKGIAIAIHVSADYYDKSQGESMMNVSFWTKYCLTPFDKGKLKLDRVNGLKDYLSPKLCEVLNKYFVKNIHIPIEQLNLSDIDFSNWDIPESSRSLYEDGYGELGNMIADNLPCDHMRSFIGDNWLGGTPIFKLKVFDAYNNSKA